MFVNCLTVTVLSYSGARSDERSGLSDSWRSGWPFLIRCQLAGSGPMEVGAAGRSADWISDRSPHDRRLKENCFVGGSPPSLKIISVDRKKN
jgi:hypothetical protein